jgi:hypothetical protein
VDFVIYRGVAVIVGFTIAEAALHSAAGEPHRETTRVVVAAALLLFVANRLRGGSATKFAAPNDEVSFRRPRDLRSRRRAAMG